MSDWLWLKDSEWPERRVMVWALIENEAGQRYVKAAYRTHAHGAWKLMAQSSKAPTWADPTENEQIIGWQAMTPPAPPIEDITPEQVASYLQRAGWKQRTVMDNDRDYWSHKDEPDVVFYLYPDWGARDYPWYLLGQVRGPLENHEHRPSELILADMARMPKGE